MNKETKPIYINAVARDFTLVNLEVWWRGEVRDDKIWTRECQLFLPYIIFEKTDEIVNGYYDPRGIEWIKGLLIKKLKADRNFLNYIEQNFMKYLSQMRDIYRNSFELSREDLLNYLDIYEKGYVWFEAAWWLWEITEKEHRFTLLDIFKRLRENTQDYVPMSEILIRKTLTKIYPELKDFIEVIRISEIKNNKVPAKKELLERKHGYYYVDDKLFTGLSRKDIEEKYNIKFEVIETKNVKEFTGVSVYKGKISGKVKIVMSVKSLDKIENGDVLVSAMTLPDFLPAIQKSAALVTDEGGMLSHAAITARELKKPCIISTKIATKVLRDGDLVEVDANNGIVKILKRV